MVMFFCGDVLYAALWFVVQNSAPLTGGLRVARSGFDPRGGGSGVLFRVGWFHRRRRDKGLLIVRSERKLRRQEY